MGFFSWKCKHCGRSLLSDMATEAHNTWMNDVVAMFEDGTRLMGSYDGYGSVGYGDSNLLDYGEEPCCYHKACWEVAGRPGYSSPSESSRDQGWFFEDEHYNLSEPPPCPEDSPKFTRNVVIDAVFENGGK